MRKHNIRLQILGLLLFGAVLGLPVATSAATVDKKGGENITQAIAQSYNADSNIKLGMIVKLKDKDATSVEPLPQDSIQKMFGVVVAANDSTVTLSPQTTTAQQVYVATAGRYTILVSSQGGPIKTGDYLTASAVTGIGMRANENQTVVLGKAAGSFDGKSNVISQVTVKDEQGHSQKVSIGRISAVIDITHNPLATRNSDYVPSFLSKAAVSVANRPVSTARIYLGTLTLLISAIVTANIVYSGVRNGMVAIGRNPLSKKSIIRSLVQTVIAGLIIFVVGVFAVYLLLKL